jgi:outer membrane protein
MMAIGFSRYWSLVPGGLAIIALVANLGAQGTPDTAVRAGSGAGLMGQPPGSMRVSADTGRPDSTVVYAAELGLKEVVSAAERYSPAVAQAAGAVRTGQSGEKVAYGEFLPSANLVASMLQTGARPLASNPSQYSSQAYVLGFLGSWDVFTGGRRWADINAAKATTKSADAGLIQQRFAVALAAKEAFYGVSYGRQLVQVSIDRVATAQRALDYARIRLQRGTATRADELLARLNVTTARQQLIAARDTLTTNAYALGRLVGIDGAVGSKGGDSLPSPVLALTDSAIIDLAVHGAPAVVAADQFSKASDAQLTSTKTEYIPDIKLAGGYNFANNSLVIGAVRPGWLVTLGTSYPLFNGFQREDDVTKASATARTAKVSAADERRASRADAERLLASVRFAWENVAESQEAVSVADEELRVVAVRYQNGVATFLDLSTAQLAQAQAQVTLVSARFDYQIARASLEALVGRDL